MAMLDMEDEDEVRREARPSLGFRVYGLGFRVQDMEDEDEVRREARPSLGFRV